MMTAKQTPGQKPFLIVEDEDKIRMLLTDTLQSLGYTFLLAKNGREGWELFQKHLPEVVLTDLMMPKMDGFTLVKKIRAHKHGRETVIIVMTAVYRDLKIKEETIFNFNVKYLIKPFPLAELIKILRPLKAGKKSPAPKEPVFPSTEPVPHAKIAGELKHFSFHLILVNFFSQRRTGILHLKSGQQHLKIYLEKGVPVFARGRERIMDKETVFSLIRTAFNWKRGSFHFEPLKTLPKEIPLHRYDFYSLIFEGAKRYYPLTLLIDKFKDYQNSRILPGKGFAGRIQLMGFSPQELDLIKNINGKNTVNDLVTLGKDSIENLFQILWILNFMEIIELK